MKLEQINAIKSIFLGWCHDENLFSDDDKHFAVVLLYGFLVVVLL